MSSYSTRRRAVSDHARGVERTGAAIRRGRLEKGECEFVPGTIGPNITFVERDYAAVRARYTALGPLLDTLGIDDKGTKWDINRQVKALGLLNRREHLSYCSKAVVSLAAYAANATEHITE